MVEISPEKCQSSFSRRGIQPQCISLREVKVMSDCFKIVILMYKLLHCETLYILMAGIVFPSFPLNYSDKEAQINVFLVTGVLETNAASIYSVFLTLVI